VSDDQGRAQPPADPLALSDSSLTFWLAHLESLHPSGQCGIELGLERVLRVKDVLSQDLQCPVITVGGTNGKGSTCAYLEAMYSFAGYRVGCYTSPHLLELQRAGAH
jgi:dihydrofolate synthase/folylpolyglutamate synthase